MKFKCGDVVRLKSGQTLMTVEGHNESGLVRCIWFEGTTLNRCVLLEDVLELDEKVEK
jgi:uncharacterized protein YodC (DUF2158 family)